MDHAQTSNVEYATLAEQLAEGGINVPPVYADMVDALRRHGELAFSTRELPASLYQAGAYISEFTNGLVADDYTAVGVDGYGNFSMYFQYYMVRGKFGLFLQLPVQGDDGDDAPAIAAINARLTEVESLLASPPAGPLAIIEVIDLHALMKGPSLNALTPTPTNDPLTTFLQDRARHDSDAVIVPL